MVNFTECANRYISNVTAQHLYEWKYPVRGITKNTTSQITVAGCNAFCGHGADYYPWSQSSSTITTWILPVVGILLQAPFESNAWWNTCLAIVRWCGSPIVTLSYILWNISVTGKCALMVDMSVPYDELPEEKGLDGEPSIFSSMRDSMYILTNMNQYTMKAISSMKEAEGLLRIVLFSKDLRLVGTEVSLAQVRHEIARSLRNGRRKGVVPVFISTAWFLFSLAISIQSAFGQLGENAIAHDLALGLLLSWLPVLILACIVDRNPVAADDIRQKLNALIDHVCDSIIDDANRQQFLDTLERKMPQKFPEMAPWVERVGHHADSIKGEFFKSFAGQGRIRWHYGAAHPILCDIEQRYIAQRGRDWLRNEEDARSYLVLGRVHEGLLWFDARELWQISAAVAIVTSTLFGAFILSYFTPTVGLGCRSGGYLIFWCFAMLLLGLELAVWWLASPIHPTEVPLLSTIRRHPTYERIELNTRGLRNICSRQVKAIGRSVKNGAITTAGVIARLMPFLHVTPSAAKLWMSKKIESWRGLPAQTWIVYCVLIPLEIFNATWLIWMVLGQTFGAFVTCNCQCSTWSSIGGYMDMAQWNFAKVASVSKYWRIGTSLSTIFMGLSLIYIVIEWCLQSHISASNYDEALAGLGRTRQFRRLTQPLRYPLARLTHVINSTRDSVFLSIRGQRQTRNTFKSTLIWSRRNGSALRTAALPPSPRFGAASPLPVYATVDYEMRRMEADGRPRADSSTSPLVRTPSPVRRSSEESYIHKLSVRTPSRDVSPGYGSEYGLGITSPEPESPDAERNLLSPLDAAARGRSDSWSRGRRES